MALEFSKIQQQEAYNAEGKLEWRFISHATVDSKPAGSIIKPTRWQVEAEIEHYMARPDKWIARAGREGKL